MLIKQDDGSNTLTVILKSGGMLTFESRDASGHDLLAFANAFPVADRDDSRK